MIEAVTVLLAVVALAAVVFSLVRDRDEEPVLGESARRLERDRRES